MISHLRSYSAAPDPTSLHVHLLNLLPSQFSLNDGTPHNQRYRCSDKSAQSNLGRGPRRSTVTHVRHKVPIGYNAPNSPSKVLLPVDQSPNPTTCLIPGPVRPMMPNGIRIRSIIIPQCTGQTDARTHQQIVHGKV